MPVNGSFASEAVRREQLLEKAGMLIRQNSQDPIERRRESDGGGSRKLLFNPESNSPCLLVRRFLDYFKIPD